MAGICEEFLHSGGEAVVGWIFRDVQIRIGSKQVSSGRYINARAAGESVAHTGA